MKTMPQEMEVWYLIPALRRELSVVFSKENGLKQKEIAKIMGITEASVSHYVKEKRGGNVKFSNPEKEIVKLYAGKIIKNPDDIMKILYELCSQLRKKGVLCRMHREMDKSVSKKCSICRG
jgi:predicted transcriptional regulator